MQSVILLSFCQCSCSGEKKKHLLACDGRSVNGGSKVVGSVWEKKVSYCLQLVQQWPAQNWQLPDGSRNYRRHGKLWNSMQLKFLPSKWVHVGHRVWKRIAVLGLLTKYTLSKKYIGSPKVVTCNPTCCPQCASPWVGLHKSVLTKEGPIPNHQWPSQHIQFMEYTELKIT